MVKKVYKLTEGDLHNMVREAVDKVLTEIGDTPNGQYMLGRLARRNNDYPVPNQISSYNVSDYAASQRHRLPSNSATAGYERGLKNAFNKGANNDDSFDMNAPYNGDKEDSPLSYTAREKQRMGKNMRMPYCGNTGVAAKHKEAREAAQTPPQPQKPKKKRGFFGF